MVIFFFTDVSIAGFTTEPLGSSVDTRNLRSATGPFTPFASTAYTNAVCSLSTIVEKGTSIAKLVPASGKALYSPLSIL